MKTVLIKDLNDQERKLYKQSNLYLEKVIERYEFTDNGLEYYQEYFGKDYKDESIIVFKDNEPVIVIYAYCKGDIFTFFADPVSIFSKDWDDQEIEYLAYRSLLKKLQELLTSNSYKSILFYSNKFIIHEYYRDISSSEIKLSLKVDLRTDFKSIKSNIRKSYKSLVNWGEKNLLTTLFNHENITDVDFMLFKKFHFEVSQRVTRSDRSWEIQLNAIRNKQAFLVSSVLDSKIVACSLILCGTKQCYYGVGVYDRELMAKNIGVAHYNILFSINHAKQNGFTEFNLGNLNIGNADNKEINIFNFKAGFTKKIGDSCFFTSNC